MGTLINAIAIVVATLLGVIFKKGLPEKIQKGVMVSLGLGLAALSLGWFLKDFFTLENNIKVSIYMKIIGSGHWAVASGFSNNHYQLMQLIHYLYSV